MSELTLDEAIKHCLEVAEQNETQADKWQEEGGEQWGKTTACRECAAEHRQLAEWLRELKEAKRLLKLAVDDMTEEADCGICLHDNDGECPIATSVCDFKWRYANEAEKLLKEESK